MAMIDIKLVQRFPWLMLPGTKQDMETRLQWAQEQESNVSPIIPPKAPKRHYEVLVRAMMHCTAEIHVEASSEADARRLARRMACRDNFRWDLSDPEDFQIEFIQETAANDR